jgi:hypothetical protein
MGGRARSEESLWILCSRAAFKVLIITGGAIAISAWLSS